LLEIKFASINEKYEKVFNVTAVVLNFGSNKNANGSKRNSESEIYPA